MTFKVLNEPDAASWPRQCRLEATDIDALTGAAGLTGVVAGCAVTAQSTPDKTVAMAAGTIIVAGVLVAVAAGNLTVTDNTSGSARRDIVVVSNAGVKSISAGTPGAAPLMTAIPASSVLVAVIEVPNAFTTITNPQILPKDVPVNTKGLELARATITSNAAVTGTLADVTGLSVTFIAPTGLVKVIVSFPYFNVGTANGYMQVDITDGANTIVQTGVRSIAVATTSFAQLRAEVVLTGLTTGTSYTYKARAIVAGGASAGTIFANAAYPAFIQALSC